MPEEPAARVTISSVHKAVSDLVVEVAKLTTSITVKDQHRSLKDEEYERRLQNHGDRIRDLEEDRARRDDHGDEIKSLKKAIEELQAAVNKSAWVPVLVTALITGITITIANLAITNSLGG